MLQIVLLWLDAYPWFFLLLIIGFLCFNFLHHKIWNNIVESLFFIPSASAEHEEYYRAKLIVEREIGLLLEFDRYSS